MDRPIDKKVQQKALQRRGLYWLLALALLLLSGYVGYTSLLTYTLERKLLRTATVEPGHVEAALSATGTVVPEFEQTISSPLDTRILKVLHLPGDSLRPQQAIMLLDVEVARISIRKLYDQLALKSNALAQLRAATEGQIIAQKGIGSNLLLEQRLRKNLMEQKEKLYQNKAISLNELQEARIAYDKVCNEHAASEATLANLQRSVQLQEEGLQLEIRILQSEIEILENQLDQAQMRMPRTGILTWVLQTEGVSVSKGSVLAKVADLSSYRVEARVSEIHAANISIGMPARVKLSLAGQSLSIGGMVSNISPSIENGVISLQIRLTEASHEALRPSQRVEVQLISAERQAAMRLYRPSFITRSGRSEVFVIRGSEAVKTTVETGLRGAETVEILSGLQPGEEVITSDMSEYAHVKKVKLQ